MIVERLEVPSAESILGTPVLLATIASVIVASVAVIDNKASLVLASLLLVAAILGIVALHLASRRTARLPGDPRDSRP